VRRLLGDVISFGAVGIVPVAGEDLAEDWVERLLDSPTLTSAVACRRVVVRPSIRRFDVPPAEVELGDGYKSLYGVVHLCDGEEVLRVRHETVPAVSESFL
jgi:hypothetical protein